MNSAFHRPIDCSDTFSLRAASAIETSPARMLNTIRDFFSGGITDARPMAHLPDSGADHALITGLPESLKRDTSTHRLRHTKATEMIEAGVPIHVVQRYFGHASPEMLMRYAATLASRAEHEFLKAKRAGAFGTPLTMNATDLYEITALSGRTDRILPNGLCLLPPVSVCEKGNACLTCGHFATDTRHLPDLHEQRRATLELIEIRQGAFAQRHGAPMPDNHVWLQQRHRELDSLDAITTALNSADTVTGAGTPARTTTEEP